MDLEAEEDYIDQKTFDRIFTNTETINYECNHTGKRTTKCEGRKTTELFYYEAMPKFLIFDLNRGIEQMTSQNNSMSDRIKKDCGIFVKLQRYDRDEIENRKYNITAISKHYGEANSGHWMNLHTVFLSVLD